MKRQDYLAAAQIAAKHPILGESAEQKRRYYLCLRDLVGMTEMENRKNPAAQLRFYRAVLCPDGGRRYRTFETIGAYCYLLPFDIASVLTYHMSSLTEGDIDALVEQIVCEFSLPRGDRTLLKTAFSAASGGDADWDRLLGSERYSRFADFLSLARKNAAFLGERPYRILITATMSAGKSTLINALVGKNVSLMQNMAATSKIHTILSKPFDDGATAEYDSEISLNATRDELMQDNEDNRTEQIVVSTFFQGGLAGQRVVLYDSPGVNFSGNAEHAEITRRMIRSSRYRLLLYVINATQMSTDSEAEHLRFVAKALRGRRVLFVMNQVDNLLTEGEAVPDIIARQRAFLEEIGFADPVICPISAKTALLAHKAGTQQLSRAERRELESRIDLFAQSGLGGYYTSRLKCPEIPDAGEEERDLLRDCGLTYLENIMLHYKEKRRDKTWPRFM